MQGAAFLTIIAAILSSGCKGLFGKKGDDGKGGGRPYGFNESRLAADDFQGTEEEARLMAQALVPGQLTLMPAGGSGGTGLRLWSGDGDADSVVTSYRYNNQAMQILQSMFTLDCIMKLVDFTKVSRNIQKVSIDISGCVSSGAKSDSGISQSGTNSGKTNDYLVEMRYRSWPKIDRTHEVSFGFNAPGAVYDKLSGYGLAGKKGHSDKGFLLTQMGDHEWYPAIHGALRWIKGPTDRNPNGQWLVHAQGIGRHKMSIKETNSRGAIEVNYYRDNWGGDATRFAGEFSMERTEAGGFQLIDAIYNAFQTGWGANGQPGGLFSAVIGPTRVLQRHTIDDINAVFPPESYSHDHDYFAKMQPGSFETCFDRENARPATESLRVFNADGTALSNQQNGFPIVKLGSSTAEGSGWVGRDHVYLPGGVDDGMQVQRVDWNENGEQLGEIYTLRVGGHRFNSNLVEAASLSDIIGLNIEGWNYEDGKHTRYVYKDGVFRKTGYYDDQAMTWRAIENGAQVTLGANQNLWAHDDLLHQSFEIRTNDSASISVQKSTWVDMRRLSDLGISGQTAQFRCFHDCPKPMDAATRAELARQLQQDWSNESLRNQLFYPNTEALSEGQIYTVTSDLHVYHGTSVSASNEITLPLLADDHNSDGSQEAYLGVRLYSQTELTAKAAGATSIWQLYGTVREFHANMGQRSWSRTINLMKEDGSLLTFPDQLKILVTLDGDNLTAPDHVISEYAGRTAAITCDGAWCWAPHGRIGGLARDWFNSENVWEKWGSIASFARKIHGEYLVVPERVVVDMPEIEVSQCGGMSYGSTTLPDADFARSLDEMPYPNFHN